MVLASASDSGTVVSSVGDSPSRSASASSIGPCIPFGLPRPISSQ